MSSLTSRSPEFRANRLAVLERDGWVCTWPGCGKPLEGLDATADHVIPLEVGLAQGMTRSELDAQSNLVAMCRYHNGRKAAQLAVRIDYRSPHWFDNAPHRDEFAPAALTL